VEAEQIATDQHLETEAANRGPQLRVPAEQPMHGVSSIRMDDIIVNAAAEQSEKDFTFPDL